MMDRVRVLAPATVSNVSCGFDIFGFAVDAPTDEVTASRTAEPGVVLATVTGDGGRLPRDSQRNTAGVAVNRYLEQVAPDAGVRLELVKGLPLGSGMGSSAASAVAAVVAVNALLGEPVSRDALLPFVLAAEAVACGAGHADNAAPCLLGGFVLVKGYDPLDVVSLRPGLDLFCALVHPDVEVQTAMARQVLPRSFDLTTVVAQTGDVAGFTAALLMGDAALMARSMRDRLAEPYRAGLIPHYDEVRDAAMRAGAIGCGISGSGPSVYGLFTDPERAERAAEEMVAVFRSNGIAGEAYVSPVNRQGARIEEA